VVLQPPQQLPVAGRRATEMSRGMQVLHVFMCMGGRRQGRAQMTVTWHGSGENEAG